jgi:hypothetical protein
MGATEENRQMLAAKFQAVFPHLDERQRRLLMGAEARSLGHGGIRLVARAAGVREATVSLGVDELDAGAGPLGRVRRPGGGRKRAADLDPGLLPALLALVEPDERGDPVSPLRWTTKSTRNLAGELTRQGHRVGADTVGDLLRAEGFSLQGNAKALEGQRHPDRDAQFRYINEQVKAHQDAADPVISVDTKKKELVGQFANAGKEWRPGGQPVPVNSHDFPQDSAGRAVPYGIYDIAGNSGWVSVGTDHDTAASARSPSDSWPSPPSRRRRSSATQLPSVPSLTPRSRATCAIGLPVSRTSRTAPSRKSLSNFRRASPIGELLSLKRMSPRWQGNPPTRSHRSRCGTACSQSAEILQPDWAR